MEIWFEICPPLILCVYRFVTEAYVVYFAMRLCGMTDVTSAPADADSLMSDADRATYFRQLSHRIVAEVWQLPSITQINDALECKVDDDYVADQWCLCRKGKQELSYRWRTARRCHMYHSMPKNKINLKWPWIFSSNNILSADGYFSCVVCWLQIGLMSRWSAVQTPIVTSGLGSMSTAWVSTTCLTVTGGAQLNVTTPSGRFSVYANSCALTRRWRVPTTTATTAQSFISAVSTCSSSQVGWLQMSLW